MNINEGVFTVMLSDARLRAKLMLVEGRTDLTIQRWARRKSNEITKPIYSSVICEHLGITVEQFYSTEPIVAENA